MKKSDYGKELVIDITGANPILFNRKDLERFMVELCDFIDMEREPLHFWDYDDPDEYAAAPPHLKGTSAVQFISTSSIVIHTLDVLESVCINIFSCKDFDAVDAQEFCCKWFGGEAVNSHEFVRGPGFLEEE